MRAFSAGAAAGSSAGRIARTVTTVFTDSCAISTSVVAGTISTRVDNVTLVVGGTVVVVVAAVVVVVVGVVVVVAGVVVVVVEDVLVEVELDVAPVDVGVELDVVELGGGAVDDDTLSVETVVVVIAGAVVDVDDELVDVDDDELVDEVAQVQSFGTVLVVDEGAMVSHVVVGVFGAKIFSKTQRTTAPGLRRIRRTWCADFGNLVSASLSFFVSAAWVLSTGGEISIGPSLVVMETGVGSAPTGSSAVRSRASSE